MHNSKLKKISVALCVALLPISVFAAGLGKLNVQSGIGEPLKADIELISVSAEELSSITAAIASEEAYAAQGIERPASHNNIKVTVAKNASGAPILKLNSAQPISEPFLDMLLQVDWNSGRLLREYTVLLDPPGYTGEVDSNTQAGSTTQAPVVQTSKMAAQADNNMAADAPVSTKKSGRKNRKVKPIADTEASSAGAETAGQEYVTQKGDTLAKIASEMKPEGVSLEQMLVGLYQTNPDAFSGDNMNRLNVGKIIRPPSEEALNALSRKAAAQEIKVQTADWNAYRNKLAGMVVDSAPADAEASGQSSSGKIKTAAEDKSMPAGNGPKDVVKLSAGDGNSAEAKSLQAKVAALQEEVTAREKGLKEAQDRTAALEKQIADMQKLLALKNNAMTDMQKQAAEASKTPVVEQKPAEIKPVEAVKPVEQAKPADVVAAPSTPEKPVEAAKPEAKPEAKPAVIAAPVEQPGFLAGMAGNLDPVLLGGAGGLLALLGGGWMFLRNKRKKNLADFEQGIMTSGGLKANTVFGNTSSSSVDTGDTSFLTDFSQSASGGMIDTNDVDPIAEAEVYMAYGRDAQAEEILKDAISKEPKRYELHLKLLEMYAASKSMSAFETVSGELYTTLGADDPIWARVAEIGIKLEPSNPLYQANASPTGGKAKLADTGAKLDASDFSDSPLAAEKDLDFSFDNDSLTKDFASESTKADDGLDMNFDAPKSLEAIKEKAQDLTSGLAGAGLTAALGTAVAATAFESFDMPTETPAMDAGLNFDMGELSTTDAPEMKASPGFSHTMPDLDFSKLVAENSSATPTFETVEEASFDLPKVDFGLQDNEVAESSNFESFEMSDAADAGDFGFDITTITADAADEGTAKTVDLSGITLDMDDAASETPVASADEPADVETKLELVSAYIEMDDEEGAKELLAEVMKEGGDNQRKRAEALLTQIG